MSANELRSSSLNDGHAPDVDAFSVTYCDFWEPKTQFSHNYRFFPNLYFGLFSELFVFSYLKLSFRVDKVKTHENISIFMTQRCLGGREVTIDITNNIKKKKKTI